jgi:hypothetical protein
MFASLSDTTSSRSGHPVGSQPVGQRRQVGGAGAEGADVRGQVRWVDRRGRRRVAGRDGGPVHGGVHIDAGGVRAGDLERARGRVAALGGGRGHGGLLRGKKKEGPRAREGVCESSFPNGDAPGAPPRMTPQNSRGQVNRRARGTRQTSATSTRGPASTVTALAGDRKARSPENLVPSR